MLGQRLGSRSPLLGSVLYPADDEGSGSFTVDGTSGKGIPQTAQEWVNAGWPSPDYLWLLGNLVSGNCPDQVGGKTLTAAGSVAYQQTIAGWSTKAVGNQGLGTAANFANATMDNLNASSVAFLVYAQFATPTTGNDRVFWGAASTNSLQNVSASNVQRLRTGANAANGALAHNGAVHPHLVVFDITNSRNALYSDIEKVSVTFAAQAGATFQWNTGTTDVNFTNQGLLAVGWKGSKAESFSTDATTKARLQALNWTVTGY